MMVMRSAVSLAPPHVTPLIVIVIVELSYVDLVPGF